MLCRTQMVCLTSYAQSLGEPPSSWWKSDVLPLGRASVVISKSPMFYHWVEPPSSLSKSYVLPLGRTSVVIINVLCSTIGSNLRRHYQTPMFSHWVEPPSSLSKSYVLPLGRTSVVIIKVLCSSTCLHCSKKFYRYFASISY